MTVTLPEKLSFPPSSPQDARVRQQIWQSLLSMLRAYAYAASLSHGEVVVIETAPYSLLLEHKGRALVITFDPLSGKGEVGLEIGFEILEDGKLRAAGEERQLDEAAIDWVEQLIRRAGE